MWLALPFVLINMHGCAMGRLPPLPWIAHGSMTVQGVFIAGAMQ
jgi:hypothetical protein